MAHAIPTAKCPPSQVDTSPKHRVELRRLRRLRRGATRRRGARWINQGIHRRDKSPDINLRIRSARRLTASSRQSRRRTAARAGAGTGRGTYETSARRRKSTSPRSYVNRDLETYTHLGDIISEISSRRYHLDVHARCAGGGEVARSAPRAAVEAHVAEQMLRSPPVGRRVCRVDEASARVRAVGPQDAGHASLPPKNRLGREPVRTLGGSGRERAAGEQAALVLVCAEKYLPN